jgi:hypothetical protein
VYWVTKAKYKKQKSKYDEYLNRDRNQKFVNIPVYCPPDIVIHEQPIDDVEINETFCWCFFSSWSMNQLLI